MPRSSHADNVSLRLRSRAIDQESRRILISRIEDSKQAEDLSVPPNCEGYGRIRHFRRHAGALWPDNPLPIDPAASSLGIAPSDVFRAQVFQNAVCNWRCWYCYVPYSLLSGSRDLSRWFTADELLDLYLEQSEPPQMIDLTGGQLDLTPEWILWILEAIQRRGFERSIYLWSDDNLSNDFFWRFLSDEDISKLARAKNYGRVGCFKGFDADSFEFNTNADPRLFDGQFELFDRFLSTGIDLYAYGTFTCLDSCGIPDKMAQFVDRLQTVHENLPLRLILLEIRSFSAVESRLTPQLVATMQNQAIAIESWNRELSQRFSTSQRAARINDIPMSR